MFYSRRLELNLRLGHSGLGPGLIATYPGISTLPAVPEDIGDRAIGIVNSSIPRPFADA
jgi:hypothetical protein